MENIKIGYIGLGCRGKDLLENIVLAQKEQVVAVCDVYEDRAREGAKVVEAAGQPTPFVSTDYKDIIANEEVNTIIIATAWESHVEIALAAMYAGKAVAMEVGGASLWKTATNWSMLMKKLKHRSCSWRTAASAAAN